MPISALSKLGIAIEASWGAGGSPAVIYPAEEWKLTSPYEQILDNAKRGVVAKDFQAYQGIGRAEGTIEGEVFPDLVGYILRATFGSVSVTGTAAPYTHTFTFSGSPPSIAMVDDTVVEQHEGKGMMVSEFRLSFSPTEGALTHSISLTGKQVGTATYTFPSETHTSAPFFLGWQGSVSLGGSFFRIIEGELTIAREVALHYNLQNTQYPGTAYAGAPEITGTFTIDYTAGSDWARYTSHQQGSIDLYYALGTRSLKIELGSVDFGEGAIEIDKSGASLSLGYSWRALYVPALGGPARAILVCNTASF